MESDLNCNIVSCGAILTDEAVTTACSHEFCLNCATQHGLLGPGPFSCPACRKPLNESRVCRQLLCPSEEWKSMVLCGLRPTVIMECAGRALGFWSYQLANQFHLQATIAKNAQRNFELLEAQANEIYSEANTRINALSSKIQAMELEEQNLRQTCEELRQREEQTAKQLSIANQLYQKLKQQYTQGGSSPSLMSTHQDPQLHRMIDPRANTDSYSQRLPESQYRGPDQERHKSAKYFPVTTGSYSRTQPAPVPLVGGTWSKAANPQYAGETPSRRLPTLNPRNSRHSLNPEQTIPSTGKTTSRFYAPQSSSKVHSMNNLGRIPEVPDANFVRGQMESGILGAPLGRSSHQRADTLTSQLGARPPSRAYGPTHRARQQY